MSAKSKGVKRNSHMARGRHSVDELTGLHLDEGTEECAELAMVLAATCSPQFLRDLIAYKGALEGIGGQLTITAIRQKYTDRGDPVAHNEAPGQHKTVAYAFSYNSTVYARGVAEQEPDAELVVPEVELDFDQPEPEPEPAIEEEPVGAGAGRGD